MADKPLSDEEIYELLHARFTEVIGKRGATALGESTLSTYRRAVLLLQTGHLKAMDDGSGKNIAIKDRTPS